VGQGDRRRGERRQVVTTTDPQVLADRFDIQDLIARYAVVLDRGDFDGLDALFTDDARIDFSTFGGPIGSLADIKAFLSASLPFFTRTQHMMGLPDVHLDGDTATARTSCNNPMISTKPSGEVSVWLIGLWYDDEFRRTEAGWRFSARTQTRCYTLTGFTDTPMGA
jgi:3-phenylpropionate/cinnamic acid dioxygenase small subunit